MNDQTRTANKLRLEGLARDLAPAGPVSTNGAGTNKDGEPIEIQVDVALKNMATGRYRLVLEALSKVEDGSYGTCETCGASIAPERLEIIPEANLCVTCQKRLETYADLAESSDDPDYLLD